MIRQLYRRLRRLVLGRSRPSIERTIPGSVRPRAIQPPVPTFGLDIDEVRNWFSDISIDGSLPGALSDYARQDTERFLRTVELVPADARHGLEIGANPYFTTSLLHWLRPDLQLTLTNLEAQGGDAGRHDVALDGPNGPDRRTLDYRNVNLETDALPFADDAFDLVLYCEVIEHLTNDPVAGLREIHRVLKPDGWLVLTTPNAARIESAARLIAGLNMYDQYSGYGPYGRHNREYTVNEIEALLSHCGFEQDRIYTADVYDNHAALHVRDPQWLAELCGARTGLLGQYIFSRWRPSGRPFPSGKPAWLYRSLPPEQLSDAVPLTEPPSARY